MAARPTSEPDKSRYRGLLGEAVRNRREHLKLTTADLVLRLAEHGVEISEKTLYSYEIGHRPIQIDDLPAFAAALKTSIKKLVPDA